MMKVTNSSFQEIDDMNFAMLVDLMVVNIITSGAIKPKASIEDFL